MKKALSILVLLGMVLGLSAFACSSTELTSAKLYVQQKNFDKAIDALEKETTKNPKSDEGFYLLGYVYGEQSNLEAMVENFDKSLAISNKFEKNIIDYNQFQWQDNFNKGVGLFNRGTKVTSEDSSKMFYDKSVERFKNCILIQPDSVGAYQNMVYSLMNGGRESELETPLLKIIELNKSRNPHSFIGDTKRQFIQVFGNPDETIQSSYENQMYETLIYNGKGIHTFIDNGKVFNVTTFGKRSTMNSGADAYVDLSKVYSNQAIVLMNSFIDSKNTVDSVEAMAIYDKQIVFLEEGQKLYPEDSKILAQLSNAYVDADRMDVAMETFQKGIENDPTNEVYRYNYGVLLLGANEYEAAIEQFDKAIEIKEDYTSAYYNLGVSYLKWGADLQEVAIEKDSEDFTYKEKFGMAVAPLERYLEENPEDASIWNYLGRVYANLGDTDKSQEAFDKADLYK